MPVNTKRANRPKVAGYLLQPRLRRRGKDDLNVVSRCQPALNTQHAVNFAAIGLVATIG
jgi:hypothetical protein